MSLPADAAAFAQHLTGCQSRLYVGRIARQYARQDEGAERQLAALESCLERLPPKQRQLVEQRYSSGVTVSGLATQSGREVNAVSATLYRIRQALAECIQKKLTAGESP